MKTLKWEKLHLKVESARPAPGKEYGYVLDNAGLWLEHGLSYIDRDWTLEGKTKTRKSKMDQPDVIGYDDEGVIREVKKPNEAEGLELMELTEELERLLIFESFVRFASANEHKPISAVYKYRDHLISKSIEMTEIESTYCSKRMRKSGFNPAKGFWYHVRKDVEKGIQEKRIIN